MSMTYYAVTDDPNELAHFGILGMKWGRRRTPEQLGHPRHSGSRSNKPRSAAYKKASAKLNKSMHKGIEKAKTKWKEYNSPKAKEARFMKKAMEKARTGTLKYGKLTDDQVRRVTERLALERNARQLGSTENPRYTKRLKMAVGEGIIRGIGMGTASYIDQRFKGRGETTARIKADKRMAKYESSRAGRRAAKRRAKNEINEEFYKTAYEEGDSSVSRLGARNRAKYVSEVNKRNRDRERDENVKNVYDQQEARLRATADSKYKDDLQKAVYTQVGKGERKLGTGSALARLNAYNESREAINKHGNSYMDSYEKDLALQRRRNNRDRKRSYDSSPERAYATAQVMQDYARTQRQRAQETAIRENAARQRELARQARIEAARNRRKRGGKT